MLSACASAHGQVALDDLFIRERWLLNAGPSILDYAGVDGAAVHDAEPIHTYALDEPYYWEKRIFLRLDPKDNPELTLSEAKDSILPLADILNAAVASKAATLWASLDYLGSDTLRRTEPIVSAPIILKIDFHIDSVTMEAVPHLVGLSVERPGGGYAHFYYPELHYVLQDHRVRTKHGLLSLDAFFTDFRFKASWIPCAKVAAATACDPSQPALEQQSEIDALMELFLLQRVIARDGVLRAGKRSVRVDLHPFGPVKASVVFDAAGDLTEAMLKRHEQVISSMHFVHGRPNGPYRAFYPNGDLREEGFFADGLRDGNWTSWYPNRNVRAHRTYVNGRLNGTQQVYYANGQQWLEYTMLRGDYEGPHRTWYADGALKATGTMHEGFISGEWDYAIRIRPTLVQELRTHNDAQYHLPGGVWKDGVISYHVTVTDNGQPGAMNSCMLGHCLQWAFSEVK